MGPDASWEALHPDVRNALKQAIVVCHLSENKSSILGVSSGLRGLAAMQVSLGAWSYTVDFFCLVQCCIRQL